MFKKTLLGVAVLISVSLGFGQYVVNFEGASEIKTAYASGTVNLSGLDWDMTEALIGTSSSDFHNGERSARLRGYASSAMTMLADKSSGLGTLTFQYRRYGTDSQADWLVQYSTDQGATWIQIGASFTAPASNVVQTFSEPVNVAGDIRIRIKRATASGTTNKRMNIDDIMLTDFVSLTEINVTGGLMAFATEEGTPSTAQSYYLSGTALTANIDISAPSGFEISTDGGATYSATASVPPSFADSVHVRMTGVMAGTFGGYLVHSSAGAENVLLPAAGVVSGQSCNAADLFFSEYLEGSSFNKALEIFNGTGAPVDLSDYKVELYSNGSATPSSSVILSGTLTDGDVFVIAYSQANAAILAVADLTSGVANFNGDDALALRKISTGAYLDIFGRIGDDPGNAWTGDGGYSTLDKTLVRKAAVSAGVSINPAGTGPTAFTTLTTEWDVYAIDTVSFLGSHTFEGGGIAVDPPTLQASGIVSYPTSTTVTLEWTPGDGARRVVKMNTVNTFTTPADGSNPTANPIWAGSGEQVIFNGSTLIVEEMPFNGCEVSGLSSNTAYWFRIYEYNGSGVFTRFLSSTAIGNPAQATTLTSQGTGYYADISGYGAALKAALHTLIKSTHTTQYSYSSLITQIPYTDEDPANPDNLIEIYTGWSVDKDDFGDLTTDWNREHTWSKSHGNFGDVAPAGTDLHHLRPCDSTVNSRKSNKDFDNGGNAYTDNSPPYGYTGETGCYDTANTWEPRAADKGDVARMLMYMAVRYEGDDSNFSGNLELVDYVYSDGGTGEPYYGKLATLLNWHVQDPPDSREMRRNDRIYERQGNRNPFIDNPRYAQYIWTPVPISNSNITTTGFTGTWTAPISATDYFLQLATDSLFVNIVPGYDNLDVNLSTSRSFSSLSEGGTYYYRLRSFFVTGYSMYSPFLAVTLAQPVIPAVILTPAQPLEEINLNGAVITLTLLNTTFTDTSLLAANFTLNGAPAGLSVQNVIYVDSATALVILAFTGEDFDVNYNSFSVTVADAEIAYAGNLISAAIAILAHVEGTAIIALDGNLIKLTVTPVPGAACYRIFASGNPYGTYSEITPEGDFDPINLNVWRIEASLAERRFFRVSAIVN